MANSAQRLRQRMTVFFLLIICALPACGNNATAVGSSLSSAPPNAGATATATAPVPSASSSTVPPLASPTSIPPTSAPSAAPTIPAATTGPTPQPAASSRPAASVGPAASVSPTSGTVQIEPENVTAIKATNRFDAIGELVNSGTAEGRITKVTATVLDDAGKTVASGSSTSTGLIFLPAGERTVFQVALTPRVDRWKDVQFQVEAIAATPSSKAALASGVVVEKLTPPTILTDKPTSISMTGQFRNTSNGRTLAPVITVAGYSADGKLTHYGRVAATVIWLASGASTPFVVELYIGPDTLPARYAYWSYANKLDTPVAPTVLEATIAGAADRPRLSYFGTVRNPSTTEVAAIQLSVTLYDEAGNVVAGNDAFATTGTDVLAPGAQTVWTAYISPVLGTVKEAKVQAHAVPPTEAEKKRVYTAVTASDVAFAPAGTTQAPRLNASGQVSNGGDGTAYLLTVVIAIYDASGKLILVDTGSVSPSDLAPAATGKFSIALYGLTTIPPKYEVVVRATRKS